MPPAGPWSMRSALTACGHASSRVAGARTGRIGVLVAPGGERSFVADRAAADQLAPDDLRAAWFDGADALHLPVYSLLGEPLGLAGRHAVDLARSAGASVSVDLASIGPLLAGGRRAARQLIADIAPDLLFATASEAEAFLGGRGVDGLLDVAATAVVKRGPKGATVLTRLGPGQDAVRGRDRATGGDRFDRRRRCVRRRIPRRLVRGARVRALAAGLAPARGDRRAPDGRSPAHLAQAGTASRLTPRGRTLPPPMRTDLLDIQPEVAAALADGRPVVALESTLISHGLPYPQNLEVATASEAAVRASGAVPATVAVHGGRLLVGLDEAALMALATAPAGSVRKAARPSLAAALADGGWAATTVSATMIAAHAAGISVFATGGIGGVHRGALGGASWAPPLRSTSRPTSRNSAGRRWRSCVPARRPSWTCRPRWNISRPAGVPVLAVGQADLPGFYARSAGIVAPSSVADIEAAAVVVAAQLGLGLGGGILVCVPVPAEDALPDDVARDAVERAVAEATHAGIGGPALTPWLLARIAVLTDGASVRANTALIVNDARVAGELAGHLARA